MYLLSLPIYKNLANESISELKTMLFLPLTSPAVFSNKEYLLHIIRRGLQKYMEEDHHDSTPKMTF